jgi:hypothetical protein
MRREESAKPIDAGDPVSASTRRRPEEAGQDQVGEFRFATT